MILCPLVTGKSLFPFLHLATAVENEKFGKLAKAELILSFLSY